MRDIITAVYETGARRFSYYNYGMISRRNLRWIAEAIAKVRTLAAADAPAEGPADAPAEGPAAAAVRVRRLTSSAIRSLRMADTAGCALNAASGPELIRIRADRQPGWTPNSVEGRANDPPGAA